MSEKDPKDMTAAELLRWAANGEPDKYGSITVLNKLFAALGGEPYSGTTYDEDVRNICALADKIDAEIEAARMNARNESFWAAFDARIALFDYPRRKDETLDEWLERCFIQRPLDESGEPVQFYDSNIDWSGTGWCQDPDMQWNATAVDCEGRLLATTSSKIIAVAKTDENGRVKRRTSEVLGADGEPIVECETVWDTESWKELIVSAITNAKNGLVHCSDDDGVYEDYDARHLTHTPPDTQERINGDAQKSSYAYWLCSGIACDDCPATIDGKKPREYFDCTNCMVAKTLDLLRRQRELDARKGGVE